MKAYLRSVFRQALCLLRPRTLVLAYHHVCPPGHTAPWLTVAPEHFAEQMAYLSGERLALSLDDFLKELRHGQIARGGRVLVTFDDASRDTLEHAYPVLERCQVPATVFVPTGLVGRGEPFWWNRLYLLDRLARSRGFELGACVRLAGAEVDWATPGDAIWRRLRFTDDPRREAVLARCAELLGQGDWNGSPRAMGWDEVGVLDGSGLVTLGAHTVTHPALAALSDEHLRAEVHGSRDALAGFRSFRKVFAYPYGDARAVSARVKKATREAGFEAGFTTTPRAVAGGEDPLALGRVCVEDMTLGEFRWMIDRFLSR